MRVLIEYALTNKSATKVKCSYKLSKGNFKIPYLLLYYT